MISEDSSDQGERARQDFMAKSQPFNIIGTSLAMVRLLDLVRIIAPKDVKVLIRGERGTGKELVADAIHSLSQRNKMPFTKINCAVLSRDLLASELFGHVKGSFTGATATRVGLIPAAETGTIFLDEVGDLSLDAQAAMLRFLQTGEVRPIGSLQSINVDVRVIAATNKNLEKAMEDGSFREDLYDRLNEFSLEVPPLRERREDIPHLIDHFIVKYNHRHGENVKRFSKEAMDFLCQYPWQGNIRDLENFVSRAVILSQGKKVIGLNQIRDILPHKITDPQGLRPTQQAIFKIAKSKQMFSIKDLQALNISERAIRKHLTPMIENGLLKPEGTRKHRRYTLSELYRNPNSLNIP